MLTDEMKKEFMAIKTGEEWNAFREKYLHTDYEFDTDMKMHFNELLHSLATKERLENPHIHYEIPRRRK